MSNNIINPGSLNTILFKIANGNVGLICTEPNLRIVQVYRDPDSVFFEISLNEQQNGVELKTDPKETFAVEMLKMVLDLLRANCKVSVLRTAMKASKLPRPPINNDKRQFGSWLIDSMAVLVEKKDDPKVLEEWKSVRKVTMLLDKGKDAWPKFFDEFERRFLSKQE